MQTEEGTKGYDVNPIGFFNTDKKIKNLTPKES